MVALRIFNGLASRGRTKIGPFLIYVTIPLRALTSGVEGEAVVDGAASGQRLVAITRRCVDQEIVVVFTILMALVITMETVDEILGKLTAAQRP